MNYTKNYRLPQWVKEDRIMMDDFNAMNTSIESGLTKTAAKADSANTKADTAVQTANAARQDVQSWKNYVTGSYTGTGADMTFHLGFRPSFVIISGMEGSYGNNVQNSYDRYFAMTGGSVLTGKITFLSTGFKVHVSAMDNYNPILTEKDRTYNYIAFR